MNPARLIINPLSRLLSLESSFGSLSISAQPRFFSNASEPQKPPPSAFLLFYRSKLDEIKELHKESPNRVTKWSKTASTMWNALDENGKRQYYDIYRERKQQYLATVSEAELMDRKKSMEERKAKNEKRRTKLEAKNLNKPKKPPSAHGLYVQENTFSSDDMKAVFAKLAQNWKAMSDSDKERYVKDAQQRKQHHEKELNDWEDEQIRNDRQHLVRVTRLKELKLVPAKPKAKKSTTEKKETKKSK